MGFEACTFGSGVDAAVAPRSDLVGKAESSVPLPAAKVAAFPGHVRTTAFLQHALGVSSSPKPIAVHELFIQVLSMVRPRVLNCWLIHLTASRTRLGGMNLPCAFLHCAAVAIVGGGHTLPVFHL